MEFKEFPKLSRLNREIVVTEKLDGTNACVIVSDNGEEVAAQSRNKLVTPSDDNYGFATWVHQNKTELLKLGPGHHFGEWWGQGIQRRYELTEKRFSLFNTNRWGPLSPDTYRCVEVACCHVVPVLYVGVLSLDAINDCIEQLRSLGSKAAPSFMKPEGVVVFHTASSHMYKKTVEKDESPKSLVK